MGSFGKTKWQMAYSLLDHPDLGDRRPSAMMAEMLSLRFETTPPDSLFLALFLRRLPASIRASTTAADCAAALLQGWIQRFGVPDTITSDRGPQFTSSLWASLCTLLSIKHTQTTAYNPQSNGLVEHFHRRLKDALRARAAGADWFLQVPWVFLGMRTACREDSDFLPAEAVFGSQLVLPGQFLSTPEPPSPNFLQDFQGVLAGRAPLPTSHHTTPSPTALPEDLLLSLFVLVRHDAVQPPLSPPYDGPFLVLERLLHFFKLQVGSRVETVSTHRLKPCHTPENAQAAEPPRMGRPPSAAKTSVVHQPLSVSSHQSCLAKSPASKHLRRVSFADPVVTAGSPPQRLPPAPPDITLGRQFTPLSDRHATQPRTNILSCKNADVE